MARLHAVTGTSSRQPRCNPDWNWCTFQCRKLRRVQRRSVADGPDQFSQARTENNLFCPIVIHCLKLSQLYFGFDSATVFRFFKATVFSNFVHCRCLHSLRSRANNDFAKYFCYDKFWGFRSWYLLIWMRARIYDCFLFNLFSERKFQVRI